MREHKLNMRFLVCLIAILVVLAIAVRVIYMTFSGQIVDADGISLSKFENGLIGTLITIVISSYFYSAVIMLRQYIVHSGKAFKLTENGIENTMVCVNLFALLFVFPVKCIPWEAVKNVQAENGGYNAKINTKKVKTNFLAKIMLLVSGYSFCNKFTKGNITKDELLLFGIKAENRFEI